MTRPAFVLLPVLLFLSITLARPLTAAEHGFAATVNPLATQAALEAMQSGGNAVDGAIAAAVMLGVVDQHNSGIGGGLFMLLRSPDGTFAAIDGRETAPAAATRDMFLRDGKAEPKLAQEGPLAAGVPGWLAALDHAAVNFGKLPLSRPLEKAAQVAEEGFVPDPGFEDRRKSWSEALSRHPETARILLAPLTDGKLKLPDLAASYRHIGAEGIGWFYGGAFGEKTEAWMKANGGLMTGADLKNYQVKRREPLRSTYRGYDIAGFPPPSSGGVHVAEILNILEAFDLRAMGNGTPDFIHTVTEAMKPASPTGRTGWAIRISPRCRAVSLLRPTPDRWPKGLIPPKPPPLPATASPRRPTRMSLGSTPPIFPS
ncbi:MAG: gamma-glutamyltransferase 1 [Verrucomicrobiales bacterium]|nr:gamma-glutamyltransferase 1 [Verrucomicrobiales bacterium]